MPLVSVSIRDARRSASCFATRNWKAPRFHQPQCASTRFMRKKTAKTGRQRVPADHRKHDDFPNLAMSSQDFAFNVFDDRSNN